MELICLLVVLAQFLGADAYQDCHYSEKPQFDRNYSILRHVDRGKDMLLNFCGASSVCHVGWMKDGEKLDFGESHVIAVTSKNESLTLRSVTASDTGLYTCVVSNNVGSVNRSIKIDVVEGSHNCTQFEQERPERPGWPLKVGGSYWVRWKVNVYTESMCIVTKINQSFEDEIEDPFIDSCGEAKSDSVCFDYTRSHTNWHVMYVTLNLTKVRKEDLGSYRILVSDKEGNNCVEPPNFLDFPLHLNETLPIKVQTKDVIAMVTTFVFIFLLCTVTWHAFKVDIQLYIKDHLGKPEVLDGRAYDAYISCTWSDVDRLFVLHLKTRLERRGYSVYVPEVDNVPGGCTVSQLVDALQRSRRFIMVLSPEYFNANYTHYEVNMFIEALDKYKECIIPIVIGGMTSLSESAIFRHVIKVTRTVQWTNIEWPLSDRSASPTGWSLNDTAVEDNRHNTSVVMEKSFQMRGFKQLLLRLPPRPKAYIRAYLPL